MQALFDGTALWLPSVNRDWAGQAEGPATSVKPRKRRLAVKMSPVAMGQRTNPLSREGAAAPLGAGLVRSNQS